MTNPKQAFDTGDNGRYYHIPAFPDQQFISVTNVIGATEAKPFLIKWAAKLALETGDVLASEKVRDAAGDRGTIIHDWIEQWALGFEPPYPEGFEAECEGFLIMAEKEKFTVTAAEATVFSPTLGYAGTADAFIEHPEYGSLVVDWKTSKALQKSVALQLTALRNAEMLLLPDGDYIPAPYANDAAAVHITSRGSKLVPVRSGPEQWEAFKAALTLAKYFHGPQKEVFK